MSIPGRTKVMRIVCAVLCAVILQCMGLRSVLAQDPETPPSTKLPAGWKDMQAEPYLKAIITLYASLPSPTVDHQREIVEHAWTHFLKQPNFVANSDWNVVELAMRVPVERRIVRIVGETPEERTASEESVKADLEQFKQQVLNRIQHDDSVLSGKDYGQVLGLTFALQRMGATPEEKDMSFIRWMALNNWQQTTYAHLTRLLEQALGAEKSTNRGSRWTGFITAPADGQYTFSQVRQWRGDVAMKVWIDGNLVLDSTPNGQGADGGDPNRFKSRPIGLTAGQRKSLKVETVLDGDLIKLLPKYDQIKMGNGLMWESADISRQLVPSSALTPPEGFGAAGATGLKGEYFVDCQLQELADTRLDPALDMIWTSAPPIPRYPEQYKQVLQECIAKAQDPTFISSLSPGHLLHYVNGDLKRLAGMMRLSQRRQLVIWLSNQPDVLRVTEDLAMGDLMASVYMLPGKEHLNLLQTWAQVRPQPRMELDPIPGRRGGDYYEWNFKRYSAIAKYMDGPYWEDVERIWQDHLSRPNGECNLALAYPTGMAAHDVGEEARKKYLARIEAGLADEKLSGDARMTWLLARAVAKETYVSGHIRPARGLPDVESAFMAAQSNAHRFWALRELIVRITALGDAQRVGEILDQHQGEFTSSEQQAQMAIWRKEVKCLMAIRAVGRAHNDLVPIVTYISDMQKRQQAAQKSGNTEGAARYAGLIAGAEQRQAAARQVCADTINAATAIEAELTALRKSQAEAQAAAAEGTTPSGQ